MSAVQFVPGRAYSFFYPRHNFHGVLSRLEPRRLHVTELRDLTQDPLDPVTVQLQPLLKRSRWLVIGHDLDNNDERSFYLDSIKKPQQIELKESRSA